MKVRKLLPILLSMLLFLPLMAVSAYTAVDLRGVMDAHAYKNETISENAVLPYRIYLPDAIAAGFPPAADNAEQNEDAVDTDAIQPPAIEIPRDRTYGLLIWLHDEDCRGTDNTAHISDDAKNGLMNAILSDPEYSSDYIIIAPQCPRDTTWTANDNLYLRLLADLINTHIRTLPVDVDRIVLGGISMGATAAYRLITMQGSDTTIPISAAYLVAGETDYTVETEEDASVFSATKVYAFLSENDTVTPPDSVKALADKINSYDFTEDFTYAIYPEVGHEVWHQAFSEQALLEAFLKTNAADEPPTSDTVPDDSETVAPDTNTDDGTSTDEMTTQTDAVDTPGENGFTISPSIIAYVMLAVSCLIAVVLLLGGLLKNNKVR